MRRPLLVSLLIFLIPSTTTALTCTPPPSVPPPRRDCRAIIAGLRWLSTLPHERGTRSWGRHMASASGTGSETLPRVFRIEGRRPPNVCAVEVDVDPLDLYAVDVFSLEELMRAAARVYAVCLEGRGLVGREEVVTGGK
ncbi:MAG: hypothetical protein Q9197_006983, partial [Variospora fuerteventurae]